MNSPMTDQQRESSHEIGYEVGEIYEMDQVLTERNHALIVSTITEEDGIPIPRSFELRSVERRYWFLRKYGRTDGEGSSKRQFLCVADGKEQLDEWTSELVSEENQTIENVYLRNEEMNVEWDEQSEKLIFMP